MQCRAISVAINACIRKTIVHFVSEHERKTKTVNFDVCKNHPELIGYSADSQHNFYFFPHFNSKTTEPIFTIFSQDV